MARHASNGRYAVPKWIDALRSSGMDCFVKAVYTHSKTIGGKKHFYVYKAAYKPDPKHSGKGKHTSGDTIGKIEGGKFIPNKTYLELKGKDQARGWSIGIPNWQVPRRMRLPVSLKRQST